MAEHTIRQSENEMSNPNVHRNPHQNQNSFKASEFRSVDTPESARPTPGDISTNIPHETERGQSRRSPSDVSKRLNGLEAQNRRLQFLLLTVYLLFGYLLHLQFSPNEVVVEEKLTQTKEVILADNAGLARMHIRMYSDRPILQLLDGNGTARLSLGMRFDDAPFIDFADKDGKTRASFNMSETDEPAIRIYDRDGKPSFTVN